MQHNLCHTRWCPIGGQLFPWVRCYRLEAVKSHRCNTLGTSHCKAVCWCRSQDTGRRLPSPVYDEHRKQHGNQERREASEIKLNGQHPRLCQMWQGYQIPHAMRKESCTQHKKMIAVGYISDTKEIVKASWSLFPHEGKAALILSQ
jgi:hypothetical protein